jgi:gas vesicle protein
MKLRYLQNLIHQETMKKERGKTAQKIAVGLGLVAAGLAAGILFALKSSKETRKELKEKAVDTVENIKGIVQKKTDAVKASAEQVSEGMCDAIDEVHTGIVKVGKDVQKGSHAVAEDLHKTAENITGG